MSSHVSVSVDSWRVRHKAIGMERSGHVAQRVAINGMSNILYMNEPGGMQDNQLSIIHCLAVIATVRLDATTVAYRVRVCLCHS